MPERRRWKGPRNQKVTDEIKAEMIALREAGYTFAKIAEIFGVAFSTVRYHIVPGEKEKNRKRAYASQKRTGSWHKRNPERTREYMRIYMRERYNNDPEFRLRMLAHVKKSDEKSRLNSKELIIKNSVYVYSGKTKK